MFYLRAQTAQLIAKSSRFTDFKDGTLVIYNLSFLRVGRYWVSKPNPRGTAQK